MLKMLVPLMLVVGSNCIYHICAKSVPDQVNTFGALTVTYLVAAILSAAFFTIGVSPSNVGAELSKVNWASILLGVVIVGLEAGWVLMYRAGWQLATASLVANIALAIALLVIGVLIFKDVVSLKQLAGIAVCAVGLFLITG